MNRESIEQAMRAGAPLTCATCQYFHEGNGFCGKSECGGPGSGKDFPTYNGPIPRERFIERCLICGDAGPTYVIILGANKTKFGLCSKHRRIYEHVGVASGLRLPVTVIALP